MDVFIIDAGTAIFDNQRHGIAIPFKPRGDDALLRRVFQRIIQQVSAQLAKQYLIPLDPHRFLFAFVAQVDMFTSRLRQAPYRFTGEK
ncbi:hypothetical protein LTSEALA_3972, partial [Salmonella enterica subsp. enterica serovar Alachua str. R6-377]